MATEVVQNPATTPSPHAVSPGVTRYLRMLAYEKEANRRVFESLETIPESARSAPGYQRAMQLLPHNQLARTIWMARLEGRPYENPSDWFPTWTIAQTKMAESEQNRQWGEYLRRLADSDLARTISYTSTEGTQYVRLIDDILTHVFNHSTYHRGQLARLVTECGGKRASTDFIALAGLGDANQDATPRAART